MTLKLRRPGEETEIEGVRFVNDSRQDVDGSILPTSVPHSLDPMVMVVSGPDRDDEICLLAARECYLSMEAALALAIELLARIRVSPHERLVNALQDIATGDETSTVAGAVAIAKHALREIGR